MSWKSQIAGNSANWAGVTGYVSERKGDLILICMSTESTVDQIRQAQAGILELDRLLSIPQMIASETQARQNITDRREY